MSDFSPFRSANKLNLAGNAQVRRQHDTQRDNDPLHDLHRTIGNQATGRLLKGGSAAGGSAASVSASPPRIQMKPKADVIQAKPEEEDYGYTPYGAVPAAPSDSGYGAYQVSPDLPAPSQPASDGYTAYGAMPATPSDSGYGAYQVSPDLPAPSQPAPDGYTAYGAMPATPSDSGYGAYQVSPHFAAESQPATGSASPAPAAPSAPAKYETKPMIDGMREFDSQQQRAGVAHAPMASTTFYADTQEKRRPYERHFENGKMFGADGQAIDTMDAKAPAAHGAKAQRHIFTMDAAGQMYTGDAIAENQGRAAKARAANESAQERFHHSSFLAGGDVAGAGEMQVRGGQVELFSDTSGHYRPGSKQMFQTAKELEAQNAGVEKIGAEFLGKLPGHGTMRSSALEVLGYEGRNLDTMELEMRVAHEKKDNTLAELKSLLPEDGSPAEALARIKADKAAKRQAAQPAAQQPAAAEAGDRPYEISDIVEDNEDAYGVSPHFDEGYEPVYTDIVEEEKNEDEDEASAYGVSPHVDEGYEPVYTDIVEEDEDDAPVYGVSPHYEEEAEQ